jgi:mannitol-1-phosphate 5-dehydrogenase
MLFAQSGYSVTFIDVDKGMVDAINERGRYPVRVLPDGGAGLTWVENVRAIDGADVAAASRAIASADIMASAVGARALQVIAPVIAEGIRLRLSETGRPLDILICENLAAANQKLAAWLSEGAAGLPEKTVRASVGLVETAIARMIPVQDSALNDGDPLMVSAEAYAFLPVDRDAFVGEMPDIEGLIPLDNFERYISRKLYVHNMGHAVCAYFGLLTGDEYIFEAVRRSDIRYAAQSAMTESARALFSEYGMPLDALLGHIEDLIKRFANTALTYSCARAGADTARKLSGSDRFIGAARLCRRNSVPSAFIEVGAAAALMIHMRESEGRDSADAAEQALRNISGLSLTSDDDNHIVKGIMKYYRMLEDGAGADALSFAALDDAACKSVI